MMLNFMAFSLSRATLHNPFIQIFNQSLHTNPLLTNHFLSLLQSREKKQDLKALNSLLVVHGLINHQPLLKQFINECCHQGYPNLALSVFKTIKKPSLYLQNLFLRSLSDNGLFEDLMCVYKFCRRSGLCSDNYTYPFVIKACAVLNNVWFGKMMHSVVLRTGFGGNLVVQTTLLDFYSKIGNMDSAHKMFDEMSKKDLIAWNALISGYSVNGFDYEVFQVFQNFCVTGLKPNACTLASVFPVCSRVGIIDFGVSLHGLTYKLGYSVVETLIPTLISMYANCGDLLSSRYIFDTSTKDSVAIWNAIISANTRNQKSENALTLFQKMLLSDVKPNLVTFVSLLPSSENLDSIWIVESFHAYIVKFGFEKTLSVSTALLSVYAKLGNMISAEFLFNNLHQRNLLSWNSILSAYAGNNLWGQSIDAFRKMQNDCFAPDAISIISILSSCSKLKATLLGKSSHAFCLKNGTYLNLNLCNAFLGFYCDINELAYSFEIFNRLILKSVVSWNTMISGCINNEESKRAMLLFHQMRRAGEDFDLVTLISILPACHKCQNSLGFGIHSHAIKTALGCNISLGNALISMYINSGEVDKAKLLFDDMPSRNVVSWNAILTGCRLCDLHNETFEFLKKMIEDDKKPNYVTLLNVLPACHTLLLGKSIHAYIFRMMVPLETPLLTSLMIMYAQFEKLASCSILFHMGEKMNISLWNTIMSVCLLTKNVTIVFSFLRELLCVKTEPDLVTVLNLISACVHFKNLCISDFVLTYLIKTGFDRDSKISNALIDMYAKCGSVSSARKLFNALQEKDTVSWSTMINGYGLHGDGEMATSLFTNMKLLGLKPDRVTYMVVLSACSHAGLVEQGKMIFNTMMNDGILPGLEHHACMVDLLGRMGYLNEAYDIVKNLTSKLRGNMLESLLSACLNHGNYDLGEEIGRLVLEMKPGYSGPYVILYKIYAAAGKWVEANNVRLVMEQNQFCKPPGMSC